MDLKNQVLDPEHQRCSHYNRLLHQHLENHRRESLQCEGQG